MRETGKGPLEAVKDPLYRLTRTDRTNPGATPPNQWTWNYDAVGNRTSAQKDSEATTSSYNEKNQLTGATGGGKMLWRGTLDEPGTASFSAATINGQPARMLAGNVFEATLDLPAGVNNVTIQAQDGSGNIATKVYSVNVIGVPSSYTYDANGNLSAKTEGADSWSYTWNALNQLTAVTKNAVAQATYSYDPLGRRVEKVAGAATTGWAYDGEDVLRYVAGATTTFVHGPGIDEPVAQQTSSATVFLHADGLGSIVLHTSSAGAVAQTLAYDAWGNLEGGSPTPYGFMAREWDAESGLSYFRHRWYDGKLGRFISEDPIRFSGGSNFFRFVDNQPTLLVDPYGLSPEEPGASWTWLPPACAYNEFMYAVEQGKAHGWRYAHCLASCRTKKNCGAATSRATQWGKEKVWDAGACLIFGRKENCFSWDQESDYEDNARGYSCPPNQTCQERCDPLADQPDTAPGPYWWIPCVRSGQCGPRAWPFIARYRP